MRSKINIQKTLSVLLLLMMGNSVFSQINYLWQDVNVSVPRQIMIDKSQIADQAITIKIENTDYIFYPDAIDTYYNGNKTVWYGSSLSKENSAIISIWKDEISGTINIANRRFRIMPHEFIEGTNIIFEEEVMHMNDCGNTHESSDLIFQELNAVASSLEELSTNITNNEPVVVRLLVAYTQAVENMSPDVLAAVEDAILRTNQIYLASEISPRPIFELACLHKVNYTETYADLTMYSYEDFKVDLANFRNTNDGYMDEIHSLRTAYGADVCIVLFDSHCDISGLASTSFVRYESAFIAINFRSITGFPLAHELGHLFGCHHDYSEGYYDAPYPFAHGYIDVTNRFRTIMGTTKLCACDPIYFFSNPRILYRGAPIGTVNREDNARVIGLRAHILGDMIQTSNVLEIDSGGRINDKDIAFPIANAKIMFKPGFKAEYGSKLSTTVGQSPTFYGAKPYVEENILIAQVNETEQTEKNIQIYPNPVTDVVNVLFEDDQKKTISLYGPTGNMLYKNDNVFKQFDLNMSTYTAGIYLLHISYKDGHVVHKKIIKENK